MCCLACFFLSHAALILFIAMALLKAMSLCWGKRTEGNHGMVVFSFRLFEASPGDVIWPFHSRYISTEQGDIVSLINYLSSIHIHESMF